MFTQPEGVSGHLVWLYSLWVMWYGCVVMAVSCDGCLTSQLCHVMFVSCDGYVMMAASQDGYIMW